VKHCFLCKWSFGATEFTGDEESPLAPVLKCWPGGYADKEQVAKEVCSHYNLEDSNENINARFGRWAR